jgi:hypothetical protein
MVKRICCFSFRWFISNSPSADAAWSVFYAPSNLFEWDFMEEASMEEASKKSFYVSQRDAYAHDYAQLCRITTGCQRHAYALPT